MRVGGQRHAPAALPPGMTIVQEAGWAPGPVWTGAENLAPTGIRSPNTCRRVPPDHLSHRPYQYDMNIRHKAPVYQLYSRNYYKAIHSKYMCCNIIKARVFLNSLRQKVRTYIQNAWFSFFPELLTCHSSQLPYFPSHGPSYS